MPFLGCKKQLIMNSQTKSMDQFFIKSNENFALMITIVEKIKTDTRKLITEWKEPNMAKVLKFYEILIELQVTQIPKSKREIYYTSVNIFKTQKTIDTLIKRITKLFNVTQIDLYISCSLKGLYYGNVQFKIDDRLISDTLLIPDMTYVDDIKLSCTKILVVEKDSIFSYLINVVKSDRRFSDVLVVTGKGYPCHNTLRFLNKLPSSIPIYGLFDYDPYGLHIFSTYKHGSKNTNIQINGMVHIGLNHKDIFEYKIDEKELIRLKPNDYSMIERLIKKHEYLRDDSMFLKGFGKKMELEILTSQNADIFVKYLVNKLDL